MWGMFTFTYLFGIFNIIIPVGYMSYEILQKLRGESHLTNQTVSESDSLLDQDISQNAQNSQNYQREIASMQSSLVI
jgi:hypothetical protein